jgi:hypothetical protein
MKDQNSAEPVAKITVLLNATAAAELVRLHKLTDLTKTDLVNKAIPLYGFLHDELTCGGTIRLTRSNGETFIVELH